MLNTFPSLLTFGLAAPFILRVVLGIIFILAGYIKIFKKRGDSIHMFSEAAFPDPVFFFWLVATVEILGGLALVLGFGTQIAAILIGLISLGGLIIKIRKPELLRQTLDFYIFALVIAISLLFTGAGFWAFDLPL